MFVGKVDEDGDHISSWVDRRCFEPCRKKCCDG
jgi:hypothetical protein